MPTTPPAARPIAVSPPRSEEILAALYHDLRTPLTVITGSAQLLARPIEAPWPDPVALAEGLARIERAVTQMAVLLDELFHLAHDASDSWPALDLRPTDLVALSRHVVDEYRPIAAGHTITVASDSTDLVGMWDEARLERVLANLLTNAVKYSPAGHPVAVRLGPATGEWARLEVADEGIGIPTADLPHVFEPYYRGANGRSQAPGAGIGLASVRAIVERHGGTVAVTSEEGRGTTVTVRLPQRPPDRT